MDRLAAAMKRHRFQERPGDDKGSGRNGKTSPGSADSRVVIRHLEHVIVILRADPGVVWRQSSGRPARLQ
jgi:hypothetical protein